MVDFDRFPALSVGRSFVVETRFTEILGFVIMASGQTIARRPAVASFAIGIAVSLELLRPSPAPSMPTPAEFGTEGPI